MFVNFQSKIWLPFIQQFQMYSRMVVNNLIIKPLGMHSKISWLKDIPYYDIPHWKISWSTLYFHCSLLESYLLWRIKTFQSWQPQDRQKALLHSIFFKNMIHKHWCSLCYVSQCVQKNSFLLMSTWALLSYSSLGMDIHGFQTPSN